MAGQDCRTWSSSAGGTALPATGSAAAGASTSATGLIAGESQASGREVAAADSRDRSNSFRLTGRAATDTTPFPYQATAVGLQWIRTRDSCQWRVPHGTRETATQP